jgi:dipeptidyl aminopeptidase/acylaminoacyl peptidase
MISSLKPRPAKTSRERASSVARYGEVQGRFEELDGYATENYLGAKPYENRRIFFDSSPISYATKERTKTSFLIINGSEDDIVNPSQAKNFQIALNQAGIYSRRIVVPGAGHFWAEEPFENNPQATAAMVAPRILRFLEEAL